MYHTEEEMELAGKMDALIRSPLEDTILQLRQSWEDPAGKAFADRLERHSEQMILLKEQIAGDIN